MFWATLINFPLTRRFDRQRRKIPLYRLSFAFSVSNSSPYPRSHNQALLCFIRSPTPSPLPYRLSVIIIHYSLNTQSRRKMIRRVGMIINRIFLRYSYCSDLFLTKALLPNSIKTMLRDKLTSFVIILLCWCFMSRQKAPIKDIFMSRWNVSEDCFEV